MNKLVISTQIPNFWNSSRCIFMASAMQTSQITSSKFTSNKGILRHIFCNVNFSTGAEGPPEQHPLEDFQANNDTANNPCRVEDHSDIMDLPADSNADAYASFLQVCTNINALKQIHALILVKGLDQNIFLATKLVTKYAMCSCLEHSRLVFDKIYQPDGFLWNVMMRVYAKNGYCEEILVLYCQMKEAGLRPDNFTFPFVLKACASLSTLREGKKIHLHIIRSGFESDVYVGNALIDMYNKCGSLNCARQVFDKMSVRDVVSWTAMIAGCAQNGHANEALELFHQMQSQNVKPNSITMASVIPACTQLGALQQGIWIHDYIIRNGIDSDVFVGAALIDMYAKSGDVEYARQLFDKMPRRDVVLWNAMINGYAENGYASDALALFNQMRESGAKPNSATMVSVLPAYAQLGSLQQARWVHDYIVRSRLESDVSVGNSLIAVYAKCSIEVACQFFEKMSERNVVSWNAMIAGYTQSGRANDALTLFNQMQLADVKPNIVTMVSVLPACAYLGALQQGKRIHDYINRSGFKSDISVGTALIDMYAKCGEIEIARQAFENMPERNVVTWSTMISGYGMQGHGEDAIALFNQMQKAGISPNHITFICILSACNHAGLVDEGLQYFNCMNPDYGIQPSMKHYACVVDLLGRAGRLDEAQDFVKRMPLEPDVGVWVSLLGACRIHCNIELGEYVAECLLVLQPQNVGYYVLLSNIYAAAGRWDGVAKVRTMMKDRGLTKPPGCSFIEVNNKVHAFLAGDQSHPQSEKIYAKLKTLAGQMELAGYVPNRNFVLHNLDEEMKDHMLYSHSEKLAIVFGLLNTISGTPIRITKNFRVCGDCHGDTKFISKIVGQEIILRDAIRFHHFKDGSCSCGDYW